MSETISVQLDRFKTECVNSRPIIPLRDTAVYSFGLKIRLTEILLLKLFGEGLLSGTTHTCLGQELCQMAVVRALDQPNDHVLSNHRNHGHFLTYSGQFFGLVAEIMGREGGVCGGIGGSQHLAYGHFHSNGVQAGMTAIGVGQALARQMDGKPGVTAIIVGDGTTGEGLLYESLNLASIWRLPVLFVVEHNHMAQTTATNATIGGEIALRGEAFGLRTFQLSDDAPDFLAKVEEVVATARAGEPSMLVIETERLGPHSKGDDLRSLEDMERIRRRDPLIRLGERLDPPEKRRIDAESEQWMKSVHQKALASPAATRLHAERHIFQPVRRTTKSCHAQVRGNVRLQLSTALRELLEDDSRVVLLGEDIHDPYGGAFKVTTGLSTKFPGRVISTPISEAGIVGTAIGLAMSGYLPVAEIMFADFLTLCMDQLYNHAVKFPGMFPNTKVPLVVRTPSGGRRGYGPTHSQSMENLMAAVPGLTVVFPSHRHPVGAALKSAVLCWPNPTVFFEHKLLYGENADTGEYRTLTSSTQDHAGELFSTVVWGEDSPDVTLVTYGGMLLQVEQMRSTLVKEELSVEIVVPSLLNPLPRHQLYNHLGRREAVVVVEEGYAETGFGSALGAALLEDGFGGRFARVRPPPVPIPAARSLETKIMPGQSKMMQAILQVLGI